MKNLTKIFMAVVAVMLVLCIADTTTEPTVELGKVKTTIDLSFEGVKTHLGDKIDKQYPLLWSTGDQIAVNGIASEPLAEEFDGKAVASFEIESETELTYPRSIVYPAPAEGTGVTFPAVQEYKAGNIADGVAPLYGYAAEAGDAITLKHLSGVLRFALKGEVSLSSITVKAATGALAGSFDIDCATGTLTAQEGKTSSEISMSFGEGLALGTEEATPIYIAVPEGKFGLVEVTLTATDGKRMAVKFDTEALPITAGVVREFGELTFAENVGEVEVFEIYTIDDLKTFAKNAATPYWKEAKLMAAIDMTGETWTPVDNYTKVFDGNRGESDEIYIKGLTAPLFGITNAQIKDLKLVDVAIVETERIISGAIACQIFEGGSLTNCETTGAFEVNNTTYEATGETHGVRSIGCMVGLAIDAPIVGCVNRATLTITSMAAAIANNTYYDFGGIVGAMLNTAGCDLKNCKNYGEIVYNHDGEGQRAKPSVGGIAGVAKSAKIENLYNNADVSLNGTTYQATPGGVVGNLLLPEEVNNIVNEGDITLAKDSYTNIGGVFGQADSNSNIEGLVFTGVVNSGNVTMKYVVVQAMIGGLIGQLADNDGPHRISIDNSNNSGAISVENAEADATVQVGGLVGRARTYTFTDCENTATGSVTVSGTAGTVTAGGLVAWNFSAHDTANPQGIMESCVNKGSVEVSATVTDAYIAGVLANKNSGYCIGCNEGAVTFSGTSTGGVRIAGNTAYISRRSNGISAERQAINKGTITFSGSAATAYVAGCIGYCLRDNQGYSLNDSTGSIVVSENASAETIYVGGVVAMMDVYSTSTKADVNANTNTGNITFNGDATTAYIGGVVGYMCDAGQTNTNSGAISIGSTAEVASLSLGGVVGFAGGNLKTLTNNGTITFEGKQDGTSLSGAGLFQVGGVVGKVAAGTHSALTNSKTGTLNIGGSVTVSTSWGGSTIGGVAGFITGTSTTLENYATINVSTVLPALTYKKSAAFTVGGAIGYGQSHTVTGVSNYGAINVSGEHNVTTSANTRYYIGGAACRNNGKVTTAYNRGKITLSNATSSTYGVFSVAGCFAMEVGTKLNPNGARNDGEIIVEESVNLGAGLYVGGVSAFEGTASLTYTPVGFVNTGNITVKGNATELYVGGVSTLWARTDAKMDMTNTGNITVKKPEDAKYSTAYVGGAVAQMLATGTGAKAYCDIQAVDFSNVGMITGSARSATVIATDCQAGGKIATTESFKKTWDDDAEDYVEGVSPDWNELNGNNYFNYIYGSVSWDGVENYDGCSWLSEKPAIAPAQ